MKARIGLPADGREAAQYMADQIIERDRGYTESLITMAGARVLNAGHHFGAKTRIPQFIGGVYREIDAFLKTGPDGWSGYLRAGCEARGILIDEEEEAFRNKTRVPVRDIHKAKETVKRINRGYYGGLKQWTDQLEIMRAAELTYFVRAMITLQAFVLVDHFGFTPGRAAVFGGEINETVMGYGSFDLGTWPDIIRGHLKDSGIVFKGYFIDPGKYGEIPALTPEQEESLRFKMTHFSTDAELKEQTKYKAILRPVYSIDRR